MTPEILERARYIVRQRGQPIVVNNILQVAQELQNDAAITMSGTGGSIRFNVQPIPVDFSDDNPYASTPRDMESIKKEMKTRHLTRSERDALHNPETDWIQTPRGEVCKNACSLEVEDIITKYKN